jgi:hypothetical protein
LGRVSQHRWREGRQRLQGGVLRVERCSRGRREILAAGLVVLALSWRSPRWRNILRLSQRCIEGSSQRRRDRIRCGRLRVARWRIKPARAGRKGLALTHGTGELSCGHPERRSQRRQRAGSSRSRTREAIAVTLCRFRPLARRGCATPGCRGCAMAGGEGDAVCMCGGCAA